MPRYSMRTSTIAVAVISMLPLAEADVRLRFNNWDRIRAQGLPVLIGYGVYLGASGVLLILGLLGS